MNKVFKVIWNRTKGCYVVTSELAKNCVSSKSSTIHKTLIPLSVALAVGVLAPVSTYASVTIGSTTGNAINSTGATATRGDTIAIGNNSSGTGKANIAIGESATAMGNQAIAIGGFVDNNTKKTISGADGTSQTIAIGPDAIVTGDQSVGLGNNVRATGNSSIAIGGDDIEKIAQDPTVAAAYTKYTGKVLRKQLYIGTTSSGAGSVAVGVRSVASGVMSTVFGTDSIASGEFSTALGTSTSATLDNSVAIGAGADTSRTATAVPNVTLNGTTYNFAGGATTLSGDQVSFGRVGYERQLKNVAAGEISTTSTDAINGSQLYALTQAVERNISFNGDAAYADTAVVKQLGQALTIDGGAAKASLTDNNIGVVSDGTKLTVKLTKDVNLGPTGSLTVGDTKVNTGGLEITGGPSVKKDGINAGNTVITGVADGKDPKDAVNMGQLTNTVNTAGWNLQDSGTTVGKVVPNNTVNFIDGTGTTATAEKSTTEGTYNVKYDVVTSNLSVDNAGDVSAANTGNAFATAGNVATAINNAVDAVHLSFNGDEAYKGTDITKKNGEKLTIDGGADKASLTDNNIGVVSDGTKLTVKLTKDVNLGPTGSLTVGDTKVNTGGLEITGGPSVKKDGINAGNTVITGVADGKDPKDAVNMGQLTNTVNTAGWNLQDSGTTVGKVVPNNTVNFIDGTGTTATAEKGTTEGTYNVKYDVVTSNLSVNDAGDVSAANTGNAFATAGNVATAINNAVDAVHLSFNGDEAYKGTDITKKNGEKLTIDGGAAKDSLTDNNIGVVSDATKLTVKLTKDVNLGPTGSLTIGDTTVNTDGVVIKDGPSVKKDGINAGDKKITGVQAGDVSKDSTDAVNGSQLYNTANSVANALGGGSTVNPDGTVTAPTYTITNVDGSTEDVKDVGSALSKINDQVVNPITFAGDSGTNVNRKLGSTLHIVGGQTEAAKLSDAPNIGVVADGTDTLTIKLAKDINLGNDGSLTVGDTTVNKDGVAINGGPSVTKDGINAGDKKITGVKAGDVSENSTDAVNGSQLHAVDAKASIRETVVAGKNMVVTSENKNATGGIEYVVKTADDVSFKTVAVTDKVTVGNVTIDAASNKISGLAPGSVSKDSTDAVNGSQLHNTANSVANALGGGSTVNPDGTVTAPTYTITNVDGTKTSVNNVGSAISTLNDQVVKPITFAGDSGTNVDRKLGSTVHIVGGQTDATKLSDAPNIGVVADGTDTLTIKLAKDINLGNDGSLTVGDTTVNKDGVAINGGPSVTKDGINAGDKKITGVKAGDVSENSTDAVNGSQLHAVDAKASIRETVVAGKNMVVTSENKNATGGIEYVVKTADDVSFKTVAVTDKVTVGNVTIDAASNKISGLAPGSVSKDSTDAVNGSQLHNTANSVANALGGDSTVNPDGTVTAPTYTITNMDGTKTAVNNVGSAISTLNDQVVKPITFAGDSGTNVDRKLGTTLHIVGGQTDATKLSSAPNIGVVANGADTLSIQLAKDISVDSVKANTVAANNVKAGTVTSDTIQMTPDAKGNTTTINGGGVTITPSNGDAVSLTSSGLNNGNNVITGVAPGAISPNSTEAVNGSQLHAVAAGVVKLDNKIDQTGAMGAALAGLKPLQYDPLEPTQIMIGVGSYHSQQSLAMGVAHYKNESTMFHAGAAMARGDYMFNAGVTWKLGSRAAEEAVPDRYKAGPISSVYVLQDEVTAMKAQNTALLAENKAQKDEIADMKAKIDMLMKNAGL